MGPSLGGGGHTPDLCPQKKSASLQNQVEGREGCLLLPTLPFKVNSQRAPGRSPHSADLTDEETEAQGQGTTCPSSGGQPERGPHLYLVLRPTTAAQHSVPVSFQALVWRRYCLQKTVGKFW